MNRVTRRLGVGAASLALAVGTAVAAASVARAGDSPGSFYYGTDSWPVSGIGYTPYQVPHTGGSYGGYMGMAGNWARTVGCHSGNFLAWSSDNSARANINYGKYGIGVGTGVYWYMGGPGVDPHYKGTAAEASAWGAQQAAWTLATVKKLGVVKYPVIWADIELPGIKPAPDNGWNAVYTGPCTGRVAPYHIPASIDRAEFNGFASYIAGHSGYKVGVYSSAGVWTSIFGTGTAAKIPNTYEWTYEPETKSVTAASAPWGWCLSRGHGACATFFGGQTSASRYALMWQWSGGGGVSNGYGDFDQIDVSRMKLRLLLKPVGGPPGKAGPPTGERGETRSAPVGGARHGRGKSGPGARGPPRPLTQNPPPVQPGDVWADGRVQLPVLPTRRVASRCHRGKPTDE